MSGKRGTWIARRGQADADLAIDQVIDQRPQPDEQIQMLADAQIADSPYQARRPFDEQSVEELAQGMREAGFQGVLVVRPHSDPPMRRRGAVQLVYGHRRRVAWRRVCAERGQPCQLPVVIREIGDQQLLTIGAQENLQRQDLDPVEEAQIVAWHQQMYFEKNQAEIGALLGKSEDWVKTRSRIQKLPDALKDRLHQRPRAISQILELAALYARQPEAALALADQVVQEQLTLDAVRAAVRDYARPAPTTVDIRDEKNNQRGTAPIVSPVTIEGFSPGVPGTATPAEQTGIPTSQQHPGRTAAPAIAGTQTAPEQATLSPPWLPSLCDRLLQTTSALRKAGGDIGVLDDASAARLADTVEELLRELEQVTRALGQREGM
jgi:ParB family transcriptional regulator, chromosome partitioning protein